MRHTGAGHTVSSTGMDCCGGVYPGWPHRGECLGQAERHALRGQARAGKRAGKRVGAREAAARGSRAGGGSCRVGGHAEGARGGRQVGRHAGARRARATYPLPPTNRPTHWRGRCRPGRGTCRGRRAQAQAHGRTNQQAATGGYRQPQRRPAQTTPHSLLTACTRWRPPVRWPVDGDGGRRRRGDGLRLSRHRQEEPPAACVLPPCHSLACGDP